MQQNHLNFIVLNPFRFLFDLKFILFRLFLILLFVAETGIVLNLFLNFEQK